MPQTRSSIRESAAPTIELPTDESMIDPQTDSQTRPAVESNAESSSRPIGHLLLPDDADPERTLPTLAALLACKTREELQRMDWNMDKCWELRGQIMESLVEWSEVAKGQRVVVTNLNRENQELRAQESRNESLISFLLPRSASAVTHQPRSARCPDPPIFEGNMEDGYRLFKPWRLEMEGKFFRNADHFTTERDKIIYVYGRTGKTAQGHPTPYTARTCSRPRKK